MKVAPVVGWLAALVSIGAGLYLLMSESASAQTTVFDALMHGIGGYLIARGLWMMASMIREAEAWKSEAKPKPMPVVGQPFARQDPPENPGFVA